MLSNNKLAIGILCITLSVLLSACNRSTAREASAPVLTSPLVLVSAEGVDAAEPVTSVAPDGSFYVAWVNHEPNNRADVMIGRYEVGKTPARAVRVNPEAGTAAAWRGDQPSVAVGKNGFVYVVWTTRVESNGKKATDLYLSVSSDLGQTFGSPVKINDDKGPAAHGMHSLDVTDDGRIYVSWLDERNVVAPKPSTKAEGHHMESNRELFIADSTDGGRTFSRNRKVAGDACPCCKTALAVAKDGTVYVSWRHVLPGNFRHIAVATSSDAGATFSKPVIISDDKWVLHGCPVSGPSLSVADNGTLKVLWYAAGEANAPGLCVTESKDNGRSFSPRQLLAQEGVRGTPVLTGDVAIWEKPGEQGSETKFRPVGQDGAAVTIGSNVELPAAAVTKDGVFVAYVSKVKDMRSVWLIKSDHKMKQIFPGILVLAFVVACGGGDHSTHSVATPSPLPSPSSAASGPEAAVARRSYPGVGTVKALNPKAPSIEIAHGDIEGLMPAMQMEFDVSDAALLNGLQVNDQIDFTIEDRTGIMRVTSIKKK